MDNRDKTNWLKRYNILDRRIKHRFDEIERLRAMLGKITATLTDMPTGGGSIYKSKDHDIIDRIADTIQMMEAELNQWADVRIEIAAAIESVQDERFRELLTYRYLNGMDWIPVAAAMHYTWGWVHKMHRRALSLIEIKEG